MLEDTLNDPTDTSTKRPKVKPLKKASTTFVPIKLDHVEPEITLPDTASPDDPITLFCLYYSLVIIDRIVKYTNSRYRAPRDANAPDTRVNAWYPIYPREIYIFIAIRIYMTLNVQPEISDY